jgi:hypothetical protein
MASIIDVVDVPEISHATEPPAKKVGRIAHLDGPSTRHDCPPLWLLTIFISSNIRTEGNEP